MHFLPDVWVECEACRGSRYSAETLHAKWHGKNIADVLAMSVADAARLFEGVPQVSRILATLVDVGLGYVTLGQPAPQLSGGEAQRVKLSRELAKPGTGSTLYILDEPTTGLHFTDIEKLLHVLERLVDSGNTVLVVEHNLEVIAAADRVIDMGPEAGDGGGRIVVEGPPEDVAIHAARWRAAGGAEGSKGRPGNGPGSAGPAAGSEPLLRSHTGEALERFGLPGLAGPTPAPTTSGSRGRTGRR
jgi:excinuclease ABC subunit A